MEEAPLKEQMRNDYQERRMKRKGTDQVAEELHLGQRDLEMEIKKTEPEKKKAEKAPRKVVKGVHREVPDKEVKTPEPIDEKLTKLKKDLEEKRKRYADEDADRTGTLKKIARTLGIPISEKKGEDVELAEKDYYDALWKYVDAEKENMPGGDKELARALLKDIALGEVTTIKSLKESKIAELQKGKNETWNKCLDKYKQAVDWWNDPNQKKGMKRKLIFAGAVFGLGVSGAAVSFTAVAASVFGAKLASRLLSMPVTYAGAKKWTDTLDAGEREYMVNLNINKLLEQNENDWGKRIKDLVKEEKSTRESYNLTNRRKAVFLASILPVIGTSVDIYKWGFGGGGGKSFLEEAKDRPETGAKVPESAKGILGTTPIEEAPKLSVAEAKLGTDARYGPGKYGPMGYGTEAEDHVPEVSELGSETIEKGGGLWKSTERLIRANPDKFKLDPNSKTFVRDARRLTKDLLDKFAEKNGIDYEDLDEIARKKIRPGDILKIVQDPSTGKPSIDYSRDEIFGQGGVPKAGVSSAVEQGTAPKGTDAQEYVPKKPDWMKPYDENIAQAKKNFDYYNLESKAAREALRASQEISYQDSVKLDNIRSLIQNRGFFTHLFSVEHLDWDEPARNYTMGYEGHIPPFPENQTWEDLQKIKFREEMIKTLRKEIGSEENLSLKDWLSRISNQQFKLMETEVRRRINY